MSCHRYRQLLCADEHPPAVTRDIDRHLDACSACRRYANEVEQLHALLGEVAATDRALPVAPAIATRSRVRAFESRQALAASLFFAVTLCLALATTPTDRAPLPNVMQPVAMDRASDHATEDTVVQFEATTPPGDVIAVTMPSVDPTVHCVWFVYTKPGLAALQQTR